jgi:NAD-dependent deacetylase
MDRKTLDRAARLITGAENAIALTGAGISVDSGIPDFRGAGGLWTRYDPAEYATIEAFRRNPGKVWVMLKEVGELCMRSSPNPGHNALAELEGMDCLRAVITQNIDGLHQRSGNRCVIEFHGNGGWLECQKCHLRIEQVHVSLDTLPPYCDCGGILKPDVVLFGESIPFRAVLQSQEEMKRCDLMLIIGTSGLVSPAAEMPYSARRAGAKIIEVNLERTIYTDSITDVFFRESASVVLPEIVSALKRLNEENPAE